MNILHSLMPLIPKNFLRHFIFKHINLSVLFFRTVDRVSNARNTTTNISIKQAKRSPVIHFLHGTHGVCSLFNAELICC